MRCLSAVDVRAVGYFRTGDWTTALATAGRQHPPRWCPGLSCASAGYAQGTPGIRHGNVQQITNLYRDYEAWHEDAGRLARSLLDMGIKGMKIWPLNPFALNNRGQSITAREIEQGLRPWQQIHRHGGHGDGCDSRGAWLLGAATGTAHCRSPGTLQAGTPSKSHEAGQSADPGQVASIDQYPRSAPANC